MAFEHAEGGFLQRGRDGGIEQIGEQAQVGGEALGAAAEETDGGFAQGVFGGGITGEFFRPVEDEIATVEGGIPGVGDGAEGEVFSFQTIEQAAECAELPRF